LLLDDSITFITSPILPDSIVGQNIYWHYDSLFYFAEDLINMQVSTPDFNSIGDTLNSYLYVNVIDSLGNVVFVSSDSICEILTCAYDPNDKTVAPTGFGPQGLILPTTPYLEFTIRFQNTGNDTSNNVIIKDQLDLNLQWQSLVPLASSHPMQIQIDQFGKVTFSMINIMLPDSNINELASHGFLKYRINLFPGLADGTIIHNMAQIYFDLNPPVLTNVTTNTIGTCFDVGEVIVNSLVQDTLCIYSSPITISGTPSGGNYSGNGVTSNQFNPSIAGQGTHYIYYNYTDVNGCSAIDSAKVFVDACLGIDPLTNYTISIYPNPFKDYTTINFGQELTGNHSVYIYDLLGQVVYSN
jgi:hypothetical protein